MMRPSTLLLDIDGTLVDNTAQHIGAWREASASLGLPVDLETLRKHMGMGGDLFVPAVAGQEWDREHGDEARDRHKHAYMRSIGEVRSVPGLERFLQGIRELGIKPVLASSSSHDEVERNLQAIGLNARDFEIVDKDDIKTSKPAPDVFAVALKRGGVPAERAAAVGDTRWDAESAAKVGLRFWGLLTGAGTAAELKAAGAEQVFRDLDELLSLLRESG